MRNLVTLNTGRFQPKPVFHDDLDLITSEFDNLTESITCVLGSYDLGVIEIQQCMKDGAVNVLASFNLATLNDKILSFVHFADLGQLVLVMQQGDIITVTYGGTDGVIDAESAIVEIVGSIDDGILGAKWSYDEETLALVTGQRNVVLLSRQFEPIAEYRIDSEDLKMSKHVDVGWGKKETQFRGKGARAMEKDALLSLRASGLVGNELRDPTMPYAVDSGEISEADRGKVTISWRGDCEFFVISTVDVITNQEGREIFRRALRVFTRDGSLDSASEPVTGQEFPLSWKPQGALIASIQRNICSADESSLNVIFFERNGLRHGEFDTRLPIDEEVADLCWNCTSEVLAVILKDRIQLWTSKNYHWYLKQEVHSSGVAFAKWHPEKDLTLLFGNESYVNISNFSYKLSLGPLLEPFDNGTVLVTDGNVVNITPLGMANVPPPEYYRDFSLPDNVVDTAVSLSNENFSVLTRDEVALASVPSLEDMRSGSHPLLVSKISKTEFATEYDTLRQVAFVNDSLVGVLMDSEKLSHIALIDVSDTNQPTFLQMVETFTKVVLLKSSFDYNHLVYETRDGQVFQVDQEGQVLPIATFPQVVKDFRVRRVENKTGSNSGSWDTNNSKTVAFGLSENGRLYANETLLTSSVTSFEIAGNILLFTTAQHYLQFAHLNSTEFKHLPPIEENVNDERIRTIERGSLLVTAMSSRFSVVLQAPRGNLETIHPRIMVLAAVRKDVLACKYGEAFQICRTHRIHLDILHDYAPQLFYDNLPHFITDIGRGDYLDLFISCLTEEDVTVTKYRETLNDAIDFTFEKDQEPPTEMEAYMKKKMFDPKKSKVNRICNAILSILLEHPELKKQFLQSIITAYACQNPPNLASALSLIASIEEEKNRDSLLTYLCFLQDVNKLYRVALSLYDIKLTLEVAQKSQMDPKEYLPFLQRLHECDTLNRKFTIDDYLKNHEKALDHLIGIESHEDEVTDVLVDYVESHELYKYALNVFKDEKAKQNTIFQSYAMHLLSKQNYEEAGAIFDMLNESKDAMKAYALGKKWKESLALAKLKFPGDIERVAQELVASLCFDHRYAEAAQIELHYLCRVTEAITLFCKSFFYDEAILTAINSKHEEYIAKLVDPALGEGFGTVTELLADCKGQMNSQLRRLRELRTKKQEDPYAFYGEETGHDDDVSMAASETSTKESFFTRYTGKTGGTAKTGASRRTAKNKRREERKRARGKKGTIYEEEYLIQSISRLVERVNQTVPEAVRLVEGLTRRDMREQAYHIQKNFLELVSLLKENANEVFTMSEKDRERIDEDGQVYYIPAIDAPKILEFPKKEYLDF
ncbi:LAMI_0A02674g1_1 [Lachancea mirantina]|uniref:Elongator complex protein 1 n=1 Tax=Lachancea mirantina TaxID=1230905 RepID=A0A1G4IML8_9SACH|nr:LAMI_0A02674g1_1 [Lachancea mirantina]